MTPLKHLSHAVGAFIFLPMIGQAAMLAVNNIDPGTTSVVDSIANTVTTSYTQTGDLDGLSDVPDTLTFDIVATYSNGGTASVSNVNYGDINPTNTVSFALTNVVYTRGNNYTNNVFSSDITAVGHFGSNNGTREFTVGNAPNTAIVIQPRFNVIDFAALGVDPVVTLDVGNNTVTFRDVDVLFDLDMSTVAIPEPSRVLLSVLGLAEITLRRRRLS